MKYVVPRIFRFSVSQFLCSSVFWFSLLLLFLPTQLGYHFWPDFTRVLGLRIDYLSPTLYFTDILTFLLLVSWGKELLFELVENPKLRLFLDFSTLFHSARRIVKRFSLTQVSLFLCFLVFVSLNILLAPIPLLALLKWLRISELTLLFLYIKNTKIPNSSFLIPTSLSISLISIIAISQFLLQSSLGGPFWLLGERTFDITTPGIAKTNLCFPTIENWSLKIGHCRMVMRPYATFSHPNSLAGFLLVSLILLFGLCTGSHPAPPSSRSSSSLRGDIHHLMQIIWRRGNLVPKNLPSTGSPRSLRSLAMTVINRPFFSLIHNSKFLIRPAIVLGTIALALTFSRTAYLAALVVILIWLAFKLLSILKNTLILSSLFIILVILSFLSPYALSYLSSFGVFATETIHNRLFLFQAAQNMILTRPLLGIGLNNFIPTLPQYLPTSPTLPLLQPVHNIFWLILAETGILGLLFALWGALKAFRHIYLLSNLSFLIFALVAILITGSNDHYWLTLPQNQILLTLVLGLVWQKDFSDITS